MFSFTSSISLKFKPMLSDTLCYISCGMTWKMLIFYFLYFFCFADRTSSTTCLRRLAAETMRRKWEQLDANPPWAPSSGWETVPFITQISLKQYNKNLTKQKTAERCKKIKNICRYRKYLTNNLIWSFPQDSLHALMATLSVSNPFFIRCIKPNMEKVTLSFCFPQILSVLWFTSMIFLTPWRCSIYDESFFNYPGRIRMCLTQKSSWTSYDTPVCWKQWRSVVLVSLFAEHLKTFFHGKYPFIYITFLCF